MIRKFATSLSLALMLSACASSGDFPSLAIRDAERAEGQFAAPEPAPPPPLPAPLSADMTQRLTQIVDQAQAAHSDFTKALPAAKRRVAAGLRAADGTDARGDALVALADLESIRTRTAVPLADIDILYTDEAVRGDLRDAVVEARATVTDLIAQEDAALAKLSGGGA
ncbi:hypothetical protein F7D01_11270 [Erythrobacter sp. 3-20A1M]|uniref:hypothetical protein n=1 Tax=Erythrobacter sp. 3-20A1M TaxID=2653850 RepID=UPI001BFC61CE|nr:hypothetical protein [Erythrobacter sp. 3-20A1M]QWC57585.1 hypothetical protein F7D01_11270 [Erythrobacter sp. 3-20A1M]